MAREKLLYVGETADRLGFRCFNPRTYEFTTEFELIFDEESVKNRVNRLRQYDDRRRLLHEGKLEKLPLVGNDYTDIPTHTLDVERSLFSGAEDSRLPTQAPVEEKTPPSHEVFNSTVSSPRALDPKAAEAMPLGLSDKSPSSAAAEDEEYRSKDSPATSKSQLTAGDVKFNQSGLSGSMGPTLRQYSDRESRSLHDTTLSETDDAKGTVDGLNVYVRSHRTPENHVRRLNDTSEANDDLSEADQVGPLTKQALERERVRSKFDPRHPVRPIRILPVSKAEPDTEDFKAFRKYAVDNDILIQMVDNPKKEGSGSWHRYNLYQDAKTLREIIELSMTAKTKAERAKQRSIALKDITYDCLHGFVLFPQHEHNSGSHYVDAGSVALIANVVNVHRLYSAAEMSEAKEVGQQQTDSENRKLVQSRLQDLQLQEGLALLSFNELIGSLWKPESSEQEIDILVQTTRDGPALVAKLVNNDVIEPESYHKIKGRSDEKEWYASVKKEHGTLKGRETWKEVKLKDVIASGHKPIKCKHVFRVKRLKDNSIQYKSRSVAQGFSQRPGEDFSLDETYAGVIGYSSVRFLFSLACQKGYSLTQTDITGAYLEAPLEEEVYMRPPPNMWVNGAPPVDEDGDEICLKLQRSLYGLRQSGHHWHECFKEFMTKDTKYNMGFTQLTSEPNLYRKTFMLNGKNEEILVGMYVDDAVVAASSEEARQWYLQMLAARFPVNEKSTGLISFDDPGRILSMHVRYDRQKGSLEFDQHEAIEALGLVNGVEKEKIRNLPIDPSIELPKLDTSEVNVTEYMSIIGSCLHLAQVSRPDVSYAVGVLARHAATPGEQHLRCARDLVNYLFNTRHHFIGYRRSDKLQNIPDMYQKACYRGTANRTIEQRLMASVPTPETNAADMYCDADYAGDKVTRKSTSGMIVMMNGGPISWSSRLQKLVALSSAESEIYAVTDSVKEAIHIRLLCEECELRSPGLPMTIWEDNTAAIHLGHGLRGNNKQKHFAVRLRFLHEHVQSKNIEFSKIDTKDQLADGFTKALPGPAFMNFRKQVLKNSPARHSVKFGVAETTVYN